MNWKEFTHRNKLYRISYCGKLQCFQLSAWVDVNTYVGNRGYLFTKCGLLHRIVAKNHIPNPNNLPQVNHKDFNKVNAHGDNLEWVTAKENTQHAIMHGKKNSGVSLGSKNGLSKLNEKQVIEIKYLFGKLKVKEIAKLYNVAPCTISDIKRGATWKHITGV